MNRIIFTRNVNSELLQALQPYTAENIFVLVDTDTCKYCLPFFDPKIIPEKNVITIEGGEEHKSLDNIARIWLTLSENGARRNAVLVNIGGGLITDVGGFAASCFKRGIKCINIPTTLLAQVDASVGGKTGINFNGLKNEIGTFSVPERVIIDPCFLRTLPLRQMLSGFAEMLKHALLVGGKHLAEVMEMDRETMYGDDFAGLVCESVGVKTKIVEADPKETGVRKALNFGHTVGHAVESCAIAQHLELYHGDAVAYGMIAELYLSVQKMGFDKQLYEQIRQFILHTYPPYPLAVEPDRLYGLMLHDKKNEREGVNFTLLKKPGEFVIDNYCKKEEIIQALSSI